MGQPQPEQLGVFRRLVEHVRSLRLIVRPPDVVMYCLRCEDSGLCTHRKNVVGASAFGWLVTLLGVTLVSAYFTMANTDGMSEFVEMLAAAVFFIVLMVVLSRVQRMFINGDATTLTCVACNGTELVPTTSSRYRRERQEIADRSSFVG